MLKTFLILPDANGVMAVVLFSFKKSTLIFFQEIHRYVLQKMMYLSMKDFFLLKNNFKIASLGGAPMIHL